MTVVRHPESIEATGIRQYLELESSLGIEGKRYFVFSNPLLFLEAQYYSNHPEECILLLPPDFTQDVDPTAHHTRSLSASASRVELVAILLQCNFGESTTSENMPQKPP